MSFALSPADQNLIRKYPDLVEATWRQIEKDFLMEGLRVEYPEDVNNPAAIYECLCNMTGQIVQNDFSSLSRLLYRIDLNENALRQKTSGKHSDEVVRIISAEILKREWQKVVFRKQFSGK